MIRFTTALVGLLLLSACTQSPSAQASAPPEFEVAEIILERNATDRDTEVVVRAKGLEAGLVSFRVSGPEGREILSLSALPSSLGVREFALESPEPGWTHVMEAYPEGVYRFEGTAADGVRLRSTARLSHDLPSPATLEVSSGVIRWTAGPVAERIVLELEREEEGEDERTLTVDLPAGVTSFEIPAAMRKPGDYQVGVGVVSRNGNVTIVEREFSAP